jgi:hypothetical protein
MSSVMTPAGRPERRSVDSAVAQATGQPEVRRSTYLIVLLLLSLFAWAPLLYPGYLQVHSGFLPVYNLASLATAPARLHWLPASVVDAGLLRGDGPLAYWLAWLIRPLLGDLGAIKAVFILSLLLGGLGVYLWTRSAARQGCGAPDVAERAGVLGAVVYVLWPPLLAAVYVRGALAEVLLMALLALALAAVAGLRGQVPWTGQFIGWFGLTTLLVAGLFLAQAGLALWAAVLLGLWALWPLGTMPGRLAAVAAVLAGVVLGGTLLWLVAGALSPGGDQVPDFTAHAIYPYQLLAAGWGFGQSTADWKDELPFQLGLAAIGMAILTVVLAAGTWRLSKSNPEPAEEHPEPADGNSTTADSHGAAAVTGSSQPQPTGLDRSELSPAVGQVLLFAALATLVPVLLATTLARPLWYLLPALVHTLSYPWQLLALAGPALALLAGLLLAVERRLALLAPWAGLVALAVLSSYPYLAPRFTQALPDPSAPAIFGGEVALLTRDVPALRPGTPLAVPEGSRDGEALAVTVNWQALQPVDFDYNVFVHAVDENGALLAQWDGQPQRNGEAYPMTSWSVGEVVPSTYRLELAPGMRDRVAAISLGLYDWQTGARLPVGSSDSVVVPLLQVAGAP